MERSFYERAVGYTFDAVKVMVCNGAPVLVPYCEHVPPDSRAGEFWLTNRRPDCWKNKRSIEHNEAIESPIRILAEQISGTPSARAFQNQRPSSPSRLNQTRLGHSNGRRTCRA